MLLGADCTKLFPIPVTDDQGNPVRTENCILQKYVITGRYIIFGVGKPNDKEIASQEVTINTLTADNSDYRPYTHDSDFTIFWPHHDYVFSDDSVTITSGDDI